MQSPTPRTRSALQSGQVRLVTPRRSAADASNAFAVSDIIPETSKISFTFIYYMVILKLFHILYILDESRREGERERGREGERGRERERKWRREPFVPRASSSEEEECEQAQ